VLDLYQVHGVPVALAELDIDQVKTLTVMQYPFLPTTYS
jgi:hypothetical protein